MNPPPILTTRAAALKPISPVDPRLGSPDPFAKRWDEDRRRRRKVTNELRFSGLNLSTDRYIITLNQAKTLFEVGPSTSLGIGPEDSGRIQVSLSGFPEAHHRTRDIPMKRAGRGFTLIELAVVVAVVGLLIAVLIPALQKVRERARRAQCVENLRQISRACYQYGTSYRCYPMGRSLQAYVDPSGSDFLGYRSGWSLFAALLPHVGQVASFNAINFSLGPYQLRNSTVSGTLQGFLWCPSDPEIVGLRYLIENRMTWDGSTLGVTYTSYGGVIGSFGFGWVTADYRKQQLAQDGMFPDVGLPAELGGPGTRPPLQIRDVVDGLSNTLLLGERAHGKLSKFNCGPGGQCSFRGNGWWASSDYGDADITAFYPPHFTPVDHYGTHALGDPGSPTARCDSATPFVMSASSFHPGGANFAFADGSIRFLRDTIDSWDYQSAARALDRDCIPALKQRPGVYQALATRDGGERDARPDF
jgi:prepilin-type N-terminal cleavage/methylation domain-containing protein/prepilin-type processing-associated H-X9-DG protein